MTSSSSSYDKIQGYLFLLGKIDSDTSHLVLGLVQRIYNALLHDLMSDTPSTSLRSYISIRHQDALLFSRIAAKLPYERMDEFRLLTGIGDCAIESPILSSSDVPMGITTIPLVIWQDAPTFTKIVQSIPNMIQRTTQLIRGLPPTDSQHARMILNQWRSCLQALHHPSPILCPFSPGQNDVIDWDLDPNPTEAPSSQQASAPHCLDFMRWMRLPVEDAKIPKHVGTAFRTYPVEDPRHPFYSLFSGQDFPQPIKFAPSRKSPSSDDRHMVYQEIGGHLDQEAAKTISRLDVWGPKLTMDVVDCLSDTSTRWTGSKVFDYYRDSFNSSPPQRPRTVLSCEFSLNKVADAVRIPTFITTHSWCDRFIDVPYSSRRERRYSLGSRYLQFADAGAATPWHVDFHATTTLMWMLTGEKIVYLIPPEENNLLEVMICEYSMPRECFPAGTRAKKVRLLAGQGILIPGGWLHAVHTVRPSTAFSSNFLHDYNISLQIQTWELEKKLKPDNVPFDIEWFPWLNWCSARDLHRRLNSNEQTMPLPETHCIRDLVHFLRRHTDLIAAQGHKYAAPAHHVSRQTIKNLAMDIENWLRDME